MTKVFPFETETERYERWFIRHQAAYSSELLALRTVLPHPDLGLEVGVGTGRFAKPLGVPIGIDPSLQMLRRARERGIKVVLGVAEALPFRNAVFDDVLIVTTICFVDDAELMLKEANRVLKPTGTVTIGFIDRTSNLGQHYLKHKDESVFYREAVFFSASEVDRLLANTGFATRTWLQTLSRPLLKTTEVEAPRTGFGDGAFVVVRGTKGG
jgi:ubiquinone/menaquinone biosynthesis C-methylase UbiE